MPFARFYNQCTEIARQETRTAKVSPDLDIGLPPGDYQFEEMYCDERGCDCRRVMFYVISSVRRDVEAVVAWGWESLEFYKRWMRDGDLTWARRLKGPDLNLGSPQGPNADAILRLTEKVLLSDPAYVERIKRHYALFREKIDRKAPRKFRKQKRKWK